MKQVFERNEWGEFRLNNETGEFIETDDSIIRRIATTTGFTPEVVNLDRSNATFDELVSEAAATYIYCESARFHVGNKAFIVDAFKTPFTAGHWERAYTKFDRHENEGEGENNAAAQHA